VHFDAEVPGVVAGKKSYLIDSLQFLVNKVVNRPNTERRWVTLGVGGFPEPKAAGRSARSGCRSSFGSGSRGGSAAPGEGGDCAGCAEAAAA